MKHLLASGVMEELEKTVCRLESMGSILSNLCAPDREAPDLTSLADLGSLICRDAMEALGLLSENEIVDESANGEEKSRARVVELPRVWFVPGIAND